LSKLSFFDISNLENNVNYLVALSINRLAFLFRVESKILEKNNFSVSAGLDSIFNVFTNAVVKEGNLEESIKVHYK